MCVCFFVVFFFVFFFFFFVFFFFFFFFCFDFVFVFFVVFFGFLLLFFSHMTSSEERMHENCGLDVFFVVSLAFFLFVDAFTVELTVD